MPHNDENWLNGKIEHIKKTEQDILKDFVKLGWECTRNDENNLTLRFSDSSSCTIWIDKKDKD